MDVNLSYFNSPAARAYVYTTLPALLDRRAAMFPDAPSHVFLEYMGPDLAFSRSVLTYSELREKSLRISSALLEMGMKPGDRVAIFGRSLAEWLHLEYACMRLKMLAIPVPTSLMYSDDLSAFLRDHQIRVLVLDPGFDANILEKLRGGISNIQDLISGAVVPKNFPERLILLASDVHESGFITITDLGAKAITQKQQEIVIQIQNSINLDNVAIVFATSGSTGIPKLVMHSHFSYINCLMEPNTNFDKLSDGENMFNNKHFSWLGSTTHESIIGGLALYHLQAPDMNDTDQVKIMLKLFEEFSITICLMLPFMMHEVRKMLTAGEVTLPKTLQVICTGGEKVQKDLAEFFKEKIMFVSGYASTEIPKIGLFVSNVHKLVDNGLVYGVAEGIEIKIVSDSGECVPLGTPGLLLSRQPTRFIGYLDDPEATSSAISPSGWTSPGDVCILHEGGLLEVIGRTSDIIIKGTIKIYPNKQEKMLLRHAEVDKVVVCGIPDQKYHEEICACVVLKAGSVVSVDELRAHCEQFQAPGQDVSLIPRHYIITDTLPFTSNGKVDKKVIRRMFIEMASSIDE